MKLNFFLPLLFLFSASSAWAIGQSVPQVAGSVVKINRIQGGYATSALANTTTSLTAASPRIQYFTGSTAGQILKMPQGNATGMAGAGDQFELHNNGSQTIAIQDSAGGAIATESANSSCWVTQLTSGNPGTWDSFCSVNGAGGGTVTSVAMSVPAFLSIAGSPIATSGTLALSLSGTALPTANGGTNVTSPGAAGNLLGSDGTNWGSSAVSYVSGLRNFGLATSVGASALTIAFKQADGSTNCSASAPCFVSFQNISASHPNGAINQRTLAAASSLVIPSTATLGSASGVNYYYYIYALDNAGTIEPAISMAWFDCTNVVSSTTIAGASNSNRTLYSTTGRTNVACRIVGQIQATEAAAGTWATAPSDISTGSYKRIWPRVQAGPTGTVGGSLSTAYATNNTLSASLIDNFNMASGSNWVAPETGTYHMAGQFDIQGTYAAGQYAGARIGNNTTGVYMYSFTRAYGAVTGDFCTGFATIDVFATAGDTLMLSSITQATGSPSFSSNLCQNSIVISKISDDPL